MTAFLVDLLGDERQFVPPGGQSWTTLPALAAGRFNSYRQHDPGIIGIGTQPTFAIGQRALLIMTPNGNVLWDCITMRCIGPRAPAASACCAPPTSPP